MKWPTSRGVRERDLYLDGLLTWDKRHPLMAPLEGVTGLYRTKSADIDQRTSYPQTRRLIKVFTIGRGRERHR